MQAQVVPFIADHYRTLVEDVRRTVLRSVTTYHFAKDGWTSAVPHFICLVLMVEADAIL